MLMASIVGFKYSIVADNLKLELEERPRGLFFMELHKVLYTIMVEMRLYYEC